MFKIITCAATVALLVLAGCGERTQRVGREFSSMQECLSFISKDMGEALNPISDKPGDVSGKGRTSNRFFRCELTVTGTRGPVLQGRWDRPK